MRRLSWDATRDQSSSSESWCRSWLGVLMLGASICYLVFVFKIFDSFLE